MLRKKRVCLTIVAIAVCVFCGFMLLQGKPKTAAAAESEAAVVLGAVQASDPINQTGLGLGINTVGAESINEFSIGYSIFDQAKLQQLTTSRINLNRNAVKSFSTTDIKDLYQHYSISLGTSVEVQTLIGSLKSSLETGASFNYSQYSYKYYFVLDQYINHYQLYINNFQDKATYSNCFSTGFLNDLEKVKSGKLGYIDFFKKYGTHFVGSALYGGRLTANYSLASNKLNFNTETKMSFENEVSVNTLSSSLAVKITQLYNRQYNKNYSVNDVKVAFYANAKGGDTFAGSYIDNFQRNYEDWCASFNNNYENSVIIDYPSNGLVPLWTVLPDAYSGLAENMKKQFTAYYETAANGVFDEFKTGDYINFAGGTGVKDDPYLLSACNHLQNIEKIDMYAHYAMIGDIDVSNVYDWEPIGDVRNNQYFCGTLDGRSHSIVGLTRIKDFDEVGNRIYFGLFEGLETGSLVKNLNFTNVNVNMTGPKRNGSGTRVFVGVLTSVLHGTVENVKLLSGKCIYDACTNGIAYVGGIAGLSYCAKVTNCANNLTLVGGRYSGYVGGMSGYVSRSTFTNCSNSGELTARKTSTGSKGCGYIAGSYHKDSAYRCTYINCSNSGTLYNHVYGGKKSQITNPLVENDPKTTLYTD